MSLSRHLGRVTGHGWHGATGGRAVTHQPCFLALFFELKETERSIVKEANESPRVLRMCLERHPARVDHALHPSHPIFHLTPRSCEHVTPNPLSHQRANRHSWRGEEGPANTLTRRCICFTARVEISHLRRGFPSFAALGSGGLTRTRMRGRVDSDGVQGPYSPMGTYPGLLLVQTPVLCRHIAHPCFHPQLAQTMSTIHRICPRT